MTSQTFHFPPLAPWLTPYYFIPTDVLDGVRGQNEDGEKGEKEDEERSESEQLSFGGGGGEDNSVVAAAASASMLVTNPLPLEGPLPATSCTQGSLRLTNPGPELTSLGKMTNKSFIVLHVLFAFL